MRNGVIQTMTGPGGAKLARKRDRDAEELIVLPDGTRLVVFEHNVRIGVFPRGSGQATSWIPLPDLVPSGNQGIEAAVRFADGRFLLIAERLGDEEGVRRAWLGEPLNALLLAAFIIVSAFHMRLGLNEVIEDYIYDRWRPVLRILNSILAAVVAALALNAAYLLAFAG